MTHKKGTFIVIEGADGSGKATQSAFLRNRLADEGFAVELHAFPRYDQSLAGKLVGEFLAGKHGDFMNLSPYLSSLPYVLDRAAAAPVLRQQLEEGVVVVSDRFTPSNMAHQMAKLPPAKRDDFVRFIERLEYDELRIPRPDMVIYLSVPADISYALILQKAQRGYLDKGKARDVAERNHEHQQKTREVYLTLTKDRSDWHMVDCAPTGVMRSKESIAEDIWRLVRTQVA